MYIHIFNKARRHAMTNNIQTIENLIREAHAAMRNGQKIAALDLSGFAGSFHKDMDQFMEEWEKKSAPLFDGFSLSSRKSPSRERLSRARTGR